jgi:ubiquinone biosynthesis protein
MQPGPTPKPEPVRARDSIQPAAHDESRTSILGVAIRDLSRLQKVSTTVARHGFGEILERSPLRRLFRKSLAADERLTHEPAPVRFRRLLEALGPTYIKLGQVLSMRPDRLPPAYIESLQQLQDNAPVVPFDQVRQVVEKGLGSSIEKLFAEFREEPFATASVAQAHRAVTMEGEQVVVKVQRPGIERTMRGDLDLLFLGARILEATIDEMEIYAPSEIVMEFEKGLLRELDFHVELANLVHARKLLPADRPRITIPRVFPELSCRTVLTMEYFKGVPLRTLEPRSERAKDAVEELLHFAFKEVFVDGFFHGDPHAGNILINDEGGICLIDWGLVGVLTPTEREDLLTLLIAAITNDADTIARILLRMGTPTRRVNMSELKADIVRFRSQHLMIATLGEADPAGVIQDFMAAAQKYRVKVATQFSIMAKAATTVEGIVRRLHPDVPIVEIARQYTEPMIRARYSPQKLLEEAFSGVTGIGVMVRHLPGQIDQVLHDVETGNLQVQAVVPNLGSALEPPLRQLGGRLSLALFATSLTLATALLLPTEASTLYYVPLVLSVLCALAAAGTWSLLLWWYFINLGRPLRLGAVLKFFRRRR